MYSLLPAFVSAVFLAFGVYILAKERVTRLSIPFIAMCAATCVWQGTSAVLFQTTNLSLAVALAKIGYLFIVFLPTTFYHLVMEVAACRRDKPLLWISYGLCALLAILVWTGSEVVNGVILHSFGYYPRAGRLHTLHVVQTVLVAGRSAWLLLRAKRRADGSGLPELFDPCLVSLGVFCLAATDYAVNYGCDFYPLGVIFIAISPTILAVAIEERDRTRTFGRPGAWPVPWRKSEGRQDR